MIHNCNVECMNNVSTWENKWKWAQNITVLCKGCSSARNQMAWTYNHTLFFSRQLGTGYMIKMKMKKNLTELELISERLRGSDTSPCYLSIFQRKDEIEEEEFYGLSKTCNRYRSMTYSLFLTLMLKLAKKLIQLKLQENIPYTLKPASMVIY